MEQFFGTLEYPGVNLGAFARSGLLHESFDRGATPGRLVLHVGRFTALVPWAHRWQLNVVRFKTYV